MVTAAFFCLQMPLWRRERLNKRSLGRCSEGHRLVGFSPPQTLHLLLLLFLCHYVSVASSQTLRRFTEIQCEQNTAVLMQHSSWFQHTAAKRVEEMMEGKNKQFFSLLLQWSRTCRLQVGFQPAESTLTLTWRHAQISEHVLAELPHKRRDQTHRPASPASWAGSPFKVFQNPLCQSCIYLQARHFVGAALTQMAAAPRNRVGAIESVVLPDCGPAPNRHLQERIFKDPQLQTRGLYFTLSGTKVSIFCIKHKLF